MLLSPQYAAASSADMRLGHEPCGINVGRDTFFTRARRESRQHDEVMPFGETRRVETMFLALAVRGKSKLHT